MLSVGVSQALGRLERWRRRRRVWQAREVELVAGESFVDGLVVGALAFERGGLTGFGEGEEEKMNVLI